MPDTEAFCTISDLPEVYRFVGGRRRFNTQRRLAADIRRHAVIDLNRRGLSQTTIAAKLGVHKSTISRDLKRVLSGDKKLRRCRHCGQDFRRLWARPELAYRLADETGAT